jgi:tetratricopeptide (TPR) repeat protein
MWSLSVGGHYDDWYATSTKAQSACRRADDRVGEGLAIVSLGQPALISSQHVNPCLVADLERAVRLLAGIPRHRARAQRTLANALRRTGQLVRPLDLFLMAHSGFAETDDRYGKVQTERWIAVSYLDLGNHEEALRWFRLAEATLQDTMASPYPVAQNAYWEGQVYLAMGRLDAASACFDLVTQTFASPESTGHAYGRHGFGQVALRRNDFATAQAELDQAALGAARVRDATLEGLVNLDRASLCLAQGQAERAVPVLNEAVSSFRACHGTYLQMLATARLSSAYRSCDRELDANVTASSVREQYTRLNLPPEDRAYRPMPVM